ncbi:hypothetical protein [Amycolatopsis sp. NPDC052450]|uniref:hypothetical protein n=1 Tax=Amycolatopsis sp. NPDC052450 TaxID=3363937 RepID=UPI0037C7258D
MAEDQHGIDVAFFGLEAEFVTYPTVWPTEAYRWLPPGMIGRIREIATSLGAGTAVIGVAIAIVLPIEGYNLHPSYNYLTSRMTVTMGVLVAACLIGSGIAMLTSRLHVATGYVRVKSAILVRGVEAGTFAGALFGTSIFLVFHLSEIGSSGQYDPQDRIEVTPGIVMYTLLPVLALILTIVNAVVAHRLLFPTAEKVRKHLERESG